MKIILSFFLIRRRCTKLIEIAFAKKQNRDRRDAHWRMGTQGLPRATPLTFTGVQFSVLKASFIPKDNHKFDFFNCKADSISSGSGVQYWEFYWNGLLVGLYSYTQALGPHCTNRVEVWVSKWKIKDAENPLKKPLTKLRKRSTSSIRFIVRVQNIILISSNS